MMLKLLLYLLDINFPFVPYDDNVWFVTFYGHVPSFSLDVRYFLLKTISSFKLSNKIDASHNKAR